MMMKSKRWQGTRSIALATATILLLSACGGDDPAPEPDTTDEPEPADEPDGDENGTETDDEAAAPDGDPVRVGIVTSSSGPYATIGQQAIDISEFAVQWFNERGGIDGRAVEAVVIDDQGTPEGSVEAMERAILQEDAPFITGTISSAQSLALAAQVEAMGGLYIAGISKTDALTGTACNPRVFRANASDSIDMSAVGPWLGERDEQTWTAIAADYEWGHDSVDLFSELAAERDMEVIATHFPALGETDFGPYISSALNDDADGLWISVSGADSINLIQQGDPFGLFDDHSAAIGNGFINDLAIGATGSLSEGVWGTVNYHHSLETGMNTEFVEAWLEMFDENPTYWHGEGFLAWQMLAAGIEAAGSIDVEDVANAMNDLEVDTLLGPGTIRGADGQLVRPNYLGQVVAVDDGYDWDIRLEVPGEVASPEPTRGCTDR